jgi:hypothetical protein
MVLPHNYEQLVSLALNHSMGCAHDMRFFTARETYFNYDTFFYFSIFPHSEGAAWQLERVDALREPF